MIEKNGLTFFLKMCSTILKEKKEQHYCLCPQKHFFKEPFHAPSNETDANMIGIIRPKSKRDVCTKPGDKKLVNICNL